MKKKVLSEEEMLRRRKINKRIYIFLGIPTLALLIFVFSLDLSDSNSNGKKDLNTEAYIVSQHFVKNKLKYPNTADFPFLDYNFNTQDSITYVISTHFTSENKLGMKVNSKYYIRLKYNGGDCVNPDNWEVLGLNIE